MRCWRLLGGATLQRIRHESSRCRLPIFHPFTVLARRVSPSCDGASADTSAVACMVAAFSSTLVAASRVSAETEVPKSVDTGSGDESGNECKQTKCNRVEADEQELVNWSGTHTVKTARYFQPETLEELRAVVQASHLAGEKLRPVGSALSPNALAFEEGGMVNMALMDDIISVDREKMQVTVQAGARVSQVVEALRGHKMTLQNFASIAEQQIGGFTQVGAHGTGVAIPPVDEQVVSLKLITPGAGEVVLAATDDDPMLFKLARTSLGLLGIVAEVTLQCVPAHDLLERTFVATHADVCKNHADWLFSNRHLRYMWIPGTDAVVVVMSNPVSAEGAAELARWRPKFSEDERLSPARDLLYSVPSCQLSQEEINALSFSALRDALLAVNPLDSAWVRKVNEAEAAYWRRSEGLRIDSSDRVLGFDCGGQQWVSEVVFPVHTVPSSGEKSEDLEYVTSVLELIDELDIPAPSPIEQRWTAPSSSPLSPACERPDTPIAPFYSWVGIIMYLPDVASSTAEEAAAVEATRSRIGSVFHSYKRACADRLWEPFRVNEHWAKVEIPKDSSELLELRTRIAKKYPVGVFNTIRSQYLDPKGILANALSDCMFGGEGEKESLDTSSS